MGEMKREQTVSIQVQGQLYSETQVWDPGETAQKSSVSTTNCQSRVENCSCCSWDFTIPRLSCPDYVDYVTFCVHVVGRGARGAGLTELMKSRIVGEVAGVA
jgi:hypothetical protein